MHLSGICSLEWALLRIELKNNRVSKNEQTIRKRKKKRNANQHWKTRADSDIFELEKAKIAEVGDGVARRFDRDDELRQLHWLRPQQIHRWTTLSRHFPGKDQNLIADAQTASSNVALFSFSCILSRACTRDAYSYRYRYAYTIKPVVFLLFLFMNFYFPLRRRFNANVG